MSKARRRSSADSSLNRVVLGALGAIALAVAGLGAQPKPAAALPVIALDTARGSIEIEVWPGEAPKSVAHILELVRKGFYRGLRFHRVEASLVQVGDPKSRDVSWREWWGREGSGNPVGVAEISKTRKHVRGTVGLANIGNAAWSDSQFYIMKAAGPSLDGKYTVIGRVTKGMEVVDRLQVADILKLASIKGEAPK